MPNGQPTNAKLTARNIEAARKKALAVRSRQAGMTFDQIAEVVGYTNRGTAYAVVKDALKDVVEQPSRELLAEEIDRCYALIRALWPRVTKGDPVAVVACLRVMERIAEYRGIDAPKQMTADLAVTYEIVGVDVGLL